MAASKYTYFWRVESPFSQHHPAYFNVDGIAFNCAEQYYMYQKASYFGDKNTALNILKSKNPSQQKSMGRKVKNFDENKWDQVAKNVVYKGNLNKFEQNKNLKNLLLAAQGTTLVEASPMDKKWGVGLDASDSRILNSNKWLGTNLLGYTLSHLLNDFVEKGDKYNESVYKYKISKSNITFWRTSSPFHPKHITPFSIDGQNFCSLHHYISYVCADADRKRNILYMFDQRKLVYDTSKMEIYMHILNGNYYKFYQNQNIRAQLLNTAGSEIIFIDNDSLIGSGSNPNNSNNISEKIDGKNLIGKCLTFLRDQWLKNDIQHPLNNIVHDFECDGSITDTFFQSDYKNSKKEYKKSKKNRKKYNEEQNSNELEFKNQYNSKNECYDIKVKKNKSSRKEMASSDATRMVWAEGRTVDSSTASKYIKKSKDESKKEKSTDCDSALIPLHCVHG